LKFKLPELTIFGFARQLRINMKTLRTTGLENPWFLYLCLFLAFSPVTRWSYKSENLV